MKKCNYCENIYKEENFLQVRMYNVEPFLLCEDCYRKNYKGCCYGCGYDIERSEYMDDDGYCIKCTKEAQDD